MNFIAWILFGFVVGIVANFIDPYPQSGGALGAVVLGVVGALVGGFLSDLFFGVGISGFNFTSFFIAILGSLLMLMVGRALRRA